jgi:hypothetical protein
MKENPERKFHAVAELFPLLEGEAFEDLVKDIERNGLREAILLDAEGSIVDGRNRYRACQVAGVEPRYEEWKGEGSLEEASLSLNLRRRHLGESQRAMVAARLAKRMETEAVRRRGRHQGQNRANLPGIEFGDSRAKAALRVNVSARLTSYAMKVLRDGCEELVEAVGNGKLAVSTAAAVAGLPEAEQKRLVEAGPKEALRRVREMRGGREGAPELGKFGVVAAERGTLAGSREAVTLLWVATAGIAAAVEALKARGFRYAPEG